MSKYCPVLEREVVYLECLDCDDKECRNTKSEDNENMHKTNKDD